MIEGVSVVIDATSWTQSWKTAASYFLDVARSEPVIWPDITRVKIVMPMAPVMWIEL